MLKCQFFYELRTVSCPSGNPMRSHDATRGRRDAFIIFIIILTIQLLILHCKIRYLKGQSRNARIFAIFQIVSCSFLKVTNLQILQIRNNCAMNILRISFVQQMVDLPLAVNGIQPLGKFGAVHCLRREVRRDAKDDSNYRD